MVVNKIKARAAFAAFVLPALVLYVAFAIVPLGLGLWVSTTNWDGTAPWVPAQVTIARFESDILAKLGSQADRDFVLKYYLKDEGQGTYRKLELIGLDRYRMMNLFSSLGYDYPDMKNVGIQNYFDIFNGKVDPRFMPQEYRANRFKPGDPLDDARQIPAAEFENNLLPNAAAAGQRDLLARAYRKDGTAYMLDPAAYGGSELDQQLFLARVAGLENDWEALYAAASDPGMTEAGLDALLAGTAGVQAGQVAQADLAGVRDTLAQVWQYGQLKAVLADSWYVMEHKMGVLLFTVFFVVLNVIGVNVLALLLALALDQNIKTKNGLRAVFYLPNVLSLIVVAFIWQLIFTQLLPSLTGVRQWMTNPEWAPWITVFVAIWQGVGYYVIVYHAGLQGIPAELLESASIDGASSFRRFFGIVLPLIMPAITISLFLSIAGSLKTFDIIFALYPGTSTSLGIDNIVVNIFYDAFRDKHAGLANAKAVLLMFAIIIISGTQLLLTRRKEVEL